MTYEEACKKWAARQLGAPLEAIQSCEMDLDSDGTESMGYSPTIWVKVRLAEGHAIQRPPQGWWGSGHSIDTEVYDFGQMVRELIEEAS